MVPPFTFNDAELQGPPNYYVDYPPNIQITDSSQIDECTLGTPHHFLYKMYDFASSTLILQSQVTMQINPSLSTCYKCW